MVKQCLNKKTQRQKGQYIVLKKADPKHQQWHQRNNIGEFYNQADSQHLQQGVTFSNFTHLPLLTGVCQANVIWLFNLQTFPVLF